MLSICVFCLFAAMEDTDIANQFLRIQQKFEDIDNRLIDLSNRVQSLDELRITKKVAYTYMQKLQSVHYICILQSI